MDKWTELDERNLFITRANRIESNVDEAINKIRKISYGNINLKNYAEIYREKVFDLEELFKNNGLSYFGQEDSETRVRSAISMYLTTEMLELLEMLNIIAKKLGGLNILYLNKTTSKLANILIGKFVEQYKNKIDEFSDFSLNENLKDILLEKLLDDRYYIYSEGNFIDFYNAMFEVMRKLGFEDVFLELDEEIKPLVVKQEQALQDFKVTETVYKPSQR